MKAKAPIRIIHPMAVEATGFSVIYRDCPEVDVTRRKLVPASQWPRRRWPDLPSTHVDGGQTAGLLSVKARIAVDFRTASIVRRS